MSKKFDLKSAMLAAANGTQKKDSKSKLAIIDAPDLADAIQSIIDGKRLSKEATSLESLGLSQITPFAQEARVRESHDRHQLQLSIKMKAQPRDLSYVQQLVYAEIEATFGKTAADNWRVNKLAAITPSVSPNVVTFTQKSVFCSIDQHYSELLKTTCEEEGVDYDAYFEDEPKIELKSDLDKSTKQQVVEKLFKAFKDTLPQFFDVKYPIKVNPDFARDLVFNPKVKAVWEKLGPDSQNQVISPYAASVKEG